MNAFDWQLQKKGCIPLSGQIVDASLVPAPKPGNTESEREAIKSGKSAKDIGPDEPNKAARRTSCALDAQDWRESRYRADGTPLPMIVLPVFGNKSHISIDRRFGIIREMAVTSASAADGRLLRHFFRPRGTSSDEATTKLLYPILNRSEKEWKNAAALVDHGEGPVRCKIR
jgi:hypothetical protein|nr:hypothetical protein [Croceicoccus marinus]|tara:strand:+ start:6127 stop:6642 length:516 start_codon:yes stop_codon:yes gene_type:complete